MNFSNLNKSIENKYKNNLNESLKETKKVSKFINKLNESQILSERKWQLTIPGTYRKSIFDAGEEEDYEGVRIALIDICDFVLSHMSEIDSSDDKEYVQDEYENFKDELEYSDIEDEDEANYWLNELYDLLDNTDIFLGINESLNEEIHPNIKMVQDRYDDAVEKGLKKQAREILSNNLIDVKNNKCVETSVNSNTKAAYFALRGLLKESLDESIDVESTDIRMLPLQAAIKAKNKFNQEAKKYPYWVIETSRWYDPEGLNIENDKFNIQFAGDYNECADWLSKLIDKAKADTDTYEIEEEGKDFVKIYYPHAISKAMFSIKKNDNIQNESLGETVPGGDYFEPGIENANDDLDNTVDNYNGEKPPFNESLNESLPEEIKKDIDKIVKTHGIKSIPKWQIQDIVQNNPEYSKEIWNYVSDLEYPDNEELEEDIDFSSPIETSFDYLHEKEAMDYQLIEPIINFFDELEKNYKCGITWNFGRRLSDDKMTAGVDIYFFNKEINDEILNKISQHLANYGFEFDSSLGYDKAPWKNHMMGNGYHTQIIEIEDVDECLTEDTIKQNGKWVNKGKEGTHGTFKTKKEADAQRKAMFANDFKG